MFEIPAFAEAPLWYAGLIWAVAMGWAASSYASSFAWRIPRGETPFGREPYCGDCNATLTPRDLFPIFSYLLSKGKCRHCGASVPCSYFLLELIYVPYMALCYIAFGFGDMFLLLVLVAMVLQVSTMMAWDDDYVSPTVNLLLLMMGLLFQLLQGNLLLDGLLGVFFGLFGALILHALLTKKPPQKDIYALPKWIWLVAATGAWLSIEMAGIFIVLWLGWAVLARLFCQERKIESWLVIVQAPALLVAIWWALLA